MVLSFFFNFLLCSGLYSFYLVPLTSWDYVLKFSNTKWAWVIQRIRWFFFFCFFPSERTWGRQIPDFLEVLGRKMTLGTYFYWRENPPYPWCMPKFYVLFTWIAWKANVTCIYLESMNVCPIYSMSICMLSSLLMCEVFTLNTMSPSSLFSQTQQSS